MVEYVILMAALCGQDTESSAATPPPVTAEEFYERGMKREKVGQQEEAISDYRKAGELKPSLFDAHFSLSSLHSERDEHKEAIAALDNALLARPGSYSALFNRGLYHEYIREFDRAIADYGEALKEEADFRYNVGSPEKCRAHAHHYRGRVFQWQKKDDASAVEDYSAAIRLDPEIEMVHYRRGQAHHRLKHYAAAQSDFEEAMRRDADYPNLLNSFAWQLATCKDEQYRDAGRALEMAQRTRHQETLAAAFASLGRFPEAIKAQESAIRQVERMIARRESGARKQDTVTLERLQASLKLFRAGEAFYE